MSAIRNVEQVNPGAIESLMKAVANYSPGNIGAIKGLQEAISHIDGSLAEIARDIKSLFPAPSNTNTSARAAKYVTDASSLSKFLYPSRAEVAARALLGLQKYDSNVAAELAARIFGEISKDVPIQGLPKGGSNV